MFIEFILRNGLLVEDDIDYGVLNETKCFHINEFVRSNLTWGFIKIVYCLYVKYTLYEEVILCR